MRHRISLLLVALLVFSAVPAFASHGWGNYHWGRPCSGATGCEASIEVRRSLTVTSRANWPDHAYKAIFGDPSNPNSVNRRGWNDSTVLALSVTNGSSDASYRSSCPAISGAVRVCNYTYGSNGWLGLAQINADSANHITWGTTKVNDTYFNGSYPITEQRHVMCQEIGHDFGLGHTSENGSSQNTCMDYYQNTSNSDWTSTGPNQHDFDQLLTQHHATEVTLPVTGMSLLSVVSAAADADGQLNEPWQWGTPVNWDPEGRPNVFELKLTDRTIVSRVIWAHDIPGNSDRVRIRR